MLMTDELRNSPYFSGKKKDLTLSEQLAEAKRKKTKQKEITKRDNKKAREKVANKTTEGLDLKSFDCVSALKEREFTISDISRLTGFTDYTVRELIAGREPKRIPFMGKLMSRKGIEVLRLISQGLTNYEIMGKIAVTETTVRNAKNKHKDIIEKLREA